MCREAWEHNCAKSDGKDAHAVSIAVMVKDATATLDFRSSEAARTLHHTAIEKLATWQTVQCKSRLQATINSYEAAPCLANLGGLVQAMEGDASFSEHPGLPAVVKLCMQRLSAAEAESTMSGKFFDMVASNHCDAPCFARVCKALARLSAAENDVLQGCDTLNMQQRRAVMEDLRKSIVEAAKVHGGEACCTDAAVAEEFLTLLDLLKTRSQACSATFEDRVGDFGATTMADLQKHVHELDQVAGGAADGDRWFESRDPAVSILDHFAETLGKVNGEQIESIGTKVQQVLQRASASTTLLAHGAGTSAIMYMCWLRFQGLVGCAVVSSSCLQHSPVSWSSDTLAAVTCFCSVCSSRLRSTSVLPRSHFG